MTDGTTTPGQAAARELDELVKSKVSNLRPKLLDLGRRNPLIASKLSPRSSSLIRVVDELPDVIFYKIITSERLRIVPLPDVETEPPEERTREFNDRLANARLTDPEYIAAIDALDPDSEEYLDKAEGVERALKDRVRTSLGLPARPTGAEINLGQHARAHGISPSYDLPSPNENQNKREHHDQNLQTLFLPKELERRLNSISSKCRTWQQETGLNVLHLAYGFLEWADSTEAVHAFAPLVLTEANLIKSKTPRGAEFSIEGTGTEPETNTVLLEKLRLEFDVALPAFGGGSIEDYLSEVARLAPKSMPFWRVRRQIAVGVFPSARMAMYHDLDPSKLRLVETDIVRVLLGGADNGEASPFADEYEVDQPEIEKHVPRLICEADSSQFSALVDVAQGRNLALEGPPGTGKSQTIVNAIAAALGAGKKVLFVAEKLAALNVVKARLEAAGLGEFLLPLQADRSAREQVIESIRERIEVSAEQSPREYGAKLNDFRRVRDDLSTYLLMMKAEFRETGLMVRDILGRTIAATPRLEAIPKDVINRCEISQAILSSDGIERVRHLASRISEAHSETLSAHPAWRTTGLLNPDRFTVDEICDIAAGAAAKFTALAAARDVMGEFGLSPAVPSPALKDIVALLVPIPSEPSTQVLKNLLNERSRSTIADLLERCTSVQNMRLALVPIFVADLGPDCLDTLLRIADVCDRVDVSSIHHDDICNEIAQQAKLLQLARGLVTRLTPLVTHYSESRGWKLRDVASAHALAKAAGRAALSLRKERLADRDPESLVMVCEEMRRLREEKRELADTFNTLVALPPDVVAEYGAVLRTAGPFGFLLPSYRRARRLYRSISRVRKFEKNEAARNFEKLAGFLRQLAELEANPSVKMIFGGRYRGLDTEFEPFEALGKFYISLEEIETASVRQFLREGSLADLERLPEIPPAAAGELTFELLATNIAPMEAGITSLEEAATALQPLTAIFSDARSVSPPRIRSLADALRRTIKEVALVDDHDAAELLGDAFAGAETNVDLLTQLIAWSSEAVPHSEQLRAVLGSERVDEARAQASAVVELEETATTLLAELTERAKVDLELLLDRSSLRKTAEQLSAAGTDPEGLFSCASFALLAEPLDKLGFWPLREYLTDQKNSFDGFGDCCEALILRRLAKNVFEDHGGRLSTFSGAYLNGLRRSVASLDRDLIALARKDLRARIVAAANPPWGNSQGRKSNYTEMALIENEVSKTQRFIPVRDLTQRAGKALLELKPCWMMSPLAVAQYVPRNSVKFDLCIIDEASQMPPESALGALLRCGQAVVVGDTNQLPPSNFFRTVLDDEDSDEDETVLNESILEMANATFRPPRRLRWHYRSRHSGLIRFSNRLVYDDDLVVFPSANETSRRMGVELRDVQGLYKSGTNPIEANAVVEAALAFMREDQTRSLGIVTLNQKQRELVREEFEARAASDSKVQDYLERWKTEKDGLEEFFIKNLENVQGDERDVIFIGTVYGPETAGGRVMQRFGPINGLAGRRRLNVLFTRAKQKVATFSSMTAADILADESGNPGAYMLKRWLEYSKTGVLEAGVVTEREPDSEFEIHVINQIRAMGCQPIPQVGVAGYFIDIGVKHPQWPHGYVIGVECDGANYHSAKSARDRDRLRQEVLEGLGWRLHRIWSTDWFNNPAREAERLRQAITERLAKLKEKELDYGRIAVAEPPLFRPRSALVSSQPDVGLRNSIKARDGEIAQSRISRVGTGDILKRPAQRSIDKREIATCVSIGDTVRVKYLADGGKELNVKISREKSDPSRGIVYCETPLAKALIGAEEGDEVSVLIGNQVRAAKIEEIIRGAEMSIN
jgi:very-short-patch-repair endonuclease